jgi:hypothetical protein
MAICYEAPGYREHSIGQYGMRGRGGCDEFDNVRVFFYLRVLILKFP